MMIKLQLNPEGVHDKKIIELIDHIPDLEVHSQVSSAIEQLIHTTQFLLKDEWEKVKEESVTGNLKKKKWWQLIFKKQIARSGR